MCKWNATLLINQTTRVTITTFLNKDILLPTRLKGRSMWSWVFLVDRLWLSVPPITSSHHGARTRYLASTWSSQHIRNLLCQRLPPDAQIFPCDHGSFQSWCHRHDGFMPESAQNSSCRWNVSIHLKDAYVKVDIWLLDTSLIILCYSWGMAWTSTDHVRTIIALYYLKIIYEMVYVIVNC